MFIASQTIFEHSSLNNGSTRAPFNSALPPLPFSPPRRCCRTGPPRAPTPGHRLPGAAAPLRTPPGRDGTGTADPSPASPLPRGDQHPTGRALPHCSSLRSQRRGHGALPGGGKQLQVCKKSPSGTGTGVPDPALPHRPGKALPAPLSHPAAASAPRARRWQRGDNPDGDAGSDRFPQPRAASKLPARETKAPPTGPADPSASSRGTL